MCLTAAAVPAEKMALDVFQAHSTLRERAAVKDVARLQPRLTPAGFTFHNEQPASIGGWVFPACEALNLRHATWLTFRRTYCSWAHDKNVPEKIVAELMGHSNVSTTLNVYTQVLHDSVRVAADRIGEELFSIVQSGEGTSELIH